MNLPYLAQADTLFASANTTTKVAGWGCYYTSTGESAGTGSFSVVTQPAHGVLSFGTGLSNGIYNGKRIPVAVAYYTWTDTNTQADQDNFALHWQQAGLQGCNIDDSLRIQKVAAPKNLGRAADCPKACEGNPIDTATGNKFQTETDFSAPAHTGLEFTRFYNSQANHTPVLGGWRSNWSATLNYDEAAGEVVATRADGRRETFRRQSDGAWQADPDVVDRLHPVADNGRQTGWLLVTNDDASETYDLDGHLLSVRLRGGQPTVLSYDGLGRMVKIGGYFGHALSLGYDASGRLTTVTAPDGKAYKYAYDTNGNLASVTYPDLSRRKYVYEDANFPHALTGIVDENNKRYASWSYDAKGRAVSSQHAGGAELTSVAYLDNGDSQVTDAMNNSHVYQFAHQFDMVKPSSVSGVAAKNLGYKTLSYDANGFVAEASDFNGNVTRYRRDTSGLELFRTEAAGTPSERTIATQWHKSLRLPVSITAPDKTTTFGYDDGRLIWRSESDGEQSREWQYRYTENGLLASIDGPRKDVEDITVFGYDESGNLKTLDNALGQRSEFLDYDANGRPLSIRDANGLETRWTYDARGRVISKQVGGVLTQYQRDAMGQVVKIIEADGSYLALTYDDAYRLIRVGDSGGNRIEYRLDANGRLQPIPGKPAWPLVLSSIAVPNDPVPAAVQRPRIADCATQLQQEKTRLEKLKADNGITETPTYTHPTEFVARIASPQIAQFVELIRLLDQLMIVMDTLWLCQVIDNKHCAEARYHWQQRLQRLANRIVTIERQAHRAAYAQGHGEEVRLARQESGLQDEPEVIPEDESVADESDSSQNADKAGSR
ncbi:RHS repeat protein [Methylomonas sp. EFPC1]|uniref:DUF6531 domain-containing protein n=1 Tax=Methylomonas sp. EFPC1 TaxID=2812647 RepID=UPI001967E509|nr:DUF6531 domain-containing protein [Methylomonas sp. EFPC1]QSA99792.1 RHS repeat protein [Methylomonas sp. EFPC1]